MAAADRRDCTSAKITRPHAYAQLALVPESPLDATPEMSDGELDAGFDELIERLSVPS